MAGFFGLRRQSPLIHTAQKSPTPGVEQTPSRMYDGSAAAVPAADPAALLLGAGIRPPVERLQPKTLTLDALVAEWRSADRKAAHAAIQLGDLADRWIRRQLTERVQPDRACAVKAIHDALAADGLAGEAVRVNRFVGIYHVARLLGPTEAEQVQVTTLRALLPLVRRDKYGQWSLRTSYRDATIALWQRIQPERLSAAAVHQAVREIRPPRKPKARRKKSSLPRILRSLGGLSREQLEELRTACDERIQVAQTVPQAVAA